MLTAAKANARYQGSLVVTAAAALGLRVEVIWAPPGTKDFVALGCGVHLRLAE